MNCLLHHSPGAAAALAQIAGTAVDPAAGSWNLRLGEAPVLASVDSPWLVITAPAADAASPLEMLRRNTGLPGGVKYAISVEAGCELRAEIPLDEETPALLGEAWNGFKTAQEMRGGEDQAAGIAGIATLELPPDLLRLAGDAGWAATLRSDHSLAIELECPGAFIQASFVQCAPGFRASVPLAGFEESPSGSALAISTLLLAAGARIRMVRPAAEWIDGQVAPRFEMVFSTLPSATQLAHALSSLSVAYRWCAEEVKALQDADLAREFLALRHGPASASGSPENQERKQT